MTKSKTQIQRMVVTAVLAAIVAVLQLVAGSIRVGPFTFTLSLVPIIIGAILYGPWTGALLGAVFGAVVCGMVVSGIDAGGFLMFQQKPFLTLFICLLKSTVAGFVAGLISKTLAENRLKLGTVLAAILCPVCNTGILSIAVLAFYRDLASQWALAAGQSSVLAYVILVMVGVNFLIELAVDLILVPVILRIIGAVKKNKTLN